MASQILEALHYPTLKTVLLVEEILKEAKEPLTRYELMKRSNNRIMRQTINTVIQYMEQRGMVLDSKKGIIWTYTPSTKMKQLLKKSREI